MEISTINNMKKEEDKEYELNKILENELKQKEEKENIIKNLVSQGRYEDVLKFISSDNNDFPEIDPEEGLIPIDGISFSSDKNKQTEDEINTNINNDNINQNEPLQSIKNNDNDHNILQNNHLNTNHNDNINNNESKPNTYIHIDIKDLDNNNISSQNIESNNIKNITVNDKSNIKTINDQYTSNIVNSEEDHKILSNTKSNNNVNTNEEDTNNNNQNILNKDNVELIAQNNNNIHIKDEYNNINDLKISNDINNIEDLIDKDNPIEEKKIEKDINNNSIINENNPKILNNENNINNNINSENINEDSNLKKSIDILDNSEIKEESLFHKSKSESGDLSNEIIFNNDLNILLDEIDNNLEQKSDEKEDIKNNKNEEQSNQNNSNNISKENINPEKIDLNKNLEMLTKELEELESYEKTESKDIDQINEIYNMIQEDKLSKNLQINQRLKLFPHYQDISYSINDVLKTDIFNNTLFLRQFNISSNFLNDNTNYNISSFNYPKSIFEQYNINNIIKKDLQLDYDDILFDYKTHYNSSKNNISELFNKRKQKKNRYKANTNKTIIINIKYNKNNSVNKNDKINKIINDWSNKASIYNKIKSIDVKQYVDTYLNSIISINPLDKEPNNIINLTLSNQNLNSIPKGDYSKSIRFLNLEDNNITKIENMENYKYLYKLNLNKNKISKIENLEVLEQLEQLRLSNNLINKIENLKNNRKLKYLNVIKNNIKDIDKIEDELPFIEELSLSKNNIDHIPNDFSLPYLKFLDITKNKITNIDNFLYLPSLETLLLRENSISDGNINENKVFEYCDKLKVIDLSFNNIKNISYIISILSNNHNIENINLQSNPIMFNVDKLMFKIFPIIFPKLYILNSIELKDPRNAISYSVLPYNTSFNSFFKYKNISKNKTQFFSKNYFNIFSSQNTFTQFFISEYFIQKIYGLFDLNINTNLKIDKTNLIDTVNNDYYSFKMYHLYNINRKCNNNLSFYNIGTACHFKTNLLNYLYFFKYKIMFIRHSIPIMSKYLTFRKIKYTKIQNYVRIFILRKKLASIKFVDEDKKDCNELLNFFDSKDYLNNDEPPNFDMLNLDKHNDLKNTLGSIIENPKEEDEKYDLNNENDLLVNKPNSINEANIDNNKTEDTNLNNDILSSNMGQNASLLQNLHNIDKRETIDDIPSFKTLIKNKQLTPLKNDLNVQQKQNIPETTKDTNNEIINETNMSQIKQVIEGLNPNNVSSSISNDTNYLNFTKTKYYPQVSNKYRKGDNFRSNYVNINSQIKFPNVLKSKNSDSNFSKPSRPESKVYLPSIKKKINDNFDNYSVSNDDSKSIKSNFTAIKSSNNYSINKFSNFKGRNLPIKTIEAIKKLEEQCKITIAKAKESWQFTNQQAIEFMAKKIKKEYKRKINKILENS